MGQVLAAQADKEGQAGGVLVSAHIRQKALSRGPLQTRDTYGHFDGDPQRKTLCGAPATDRDLSWAETRHENASALKYVTCPECLDARRFLLDGLALAPH